MLSNKWLSIRIHEDTYNILKKINQKTDVPMARLLKKIIEEYAKENGVT